MLQQWDIGGIILSMANDVILYNAIANKLSSVLVGGKISKINQPSEYEVVFSIAKNGAELPLTISANGELSRIEIKKGLSENPISAPAFTMLLRKYLKNARIENVALYNNDRIIAITLKSKNELRDNTLFRLYYEAMGRYTNIVLVDEKNIVLDAIKRVGIGMSDRVIMPSVEYPLQPHVKTPLSEWDKVCDVLNNVATATDIVANISGISKDTAVEIMASKDRIARLRDMLGDNGNSGYIYTIGEKEVLTPTPYHTLGEAKVVFGSILDGVSYLYQSKAERDSKDRQTKEHLRLVKNLKNKHTKTYKQARDTIDNKHVNDQYRTQGELILCNVYRINKGDTTLIATDYATMQEISIPLDPLKTPKENAEWLFRKYKKGKKSIEIAQAQLENSSEMLAYLSEIEAQLLLCNTKIELDEILSELRGIAGKRYVSDKKAKKAKPSPIMTIDYEGYKILIGKNNQQNDRLTFDIAKGGDVWLHVKDYHGSHVIIVSDNREVPDSVIIRAAQLASYYSTARDAQKVDVDYTIRKNVKRQGKLPGMVTYKNYKTVTVTPCGAKD